VANVKEVVDNALKGIGIPGDACSWRVGKAIKKFTETETVRRGIPDVMGTECSPGCATAFSRCDVTEDVMVVWMDSTEHGPICE
jgi:hypothetical protein